VIPDPDQSAPADSPAGRPLDPPPVGDMVSLDPRVILYWRIQSLISSAVLLVVFLVLGGFVAVKVPGSLPVVACAWVALFGFRLGLLIWLPVRCYRAWSYRMDDKVLETRHGIWFRVTTLLPLSRLQHVDLHRGPIERYLGLASLMLQTAGTQHATIVIPGLDATLAPQLRDQLVAAGGDDAV
jgi:membrane protein YdbS with pleckstrin-like domain